MLWKIIKIFRYQVTTHHITVWLFWKFWKKFFYLYSNLYLNLKIREKNHRNVSRRLENPSIKVKGFYLLLNIDRTLSQSPCLKSSTFKLTSSYEKEKNSKERQLIQSLCNIWIEFGLFLYNIMHLIYT